MLTFQIVQFALTFVLACAVGYVGYRQWRTAQERIVIDLFEKRWEAYNAIRKPIGDVLAHGISPSKVSLEFLQASDKAIFLFGQDVNDFLSATYQRLLDLDLANTQMSVGGADYSKWVDKRTANFTALANFYRELSPLLRRYMSMPQKMP